MQVRSLPLLQFQQQYAGDIEAALLARVTGRLEVTPCRSGQKLIHAGCLAADALSHEVMYLAAAVAQDPTDATAGLDHQRWLVALPGRCPAAMQAVRRQRSRWPLPLWRGPQGAHGPRRRALMQRPRHRPAARHAQPGACKSSCSLRCARWCIGCVSSGCLP